MITKRGIWLSYNSFKLTDGQIIRVIPYIYLNSILDKETFPFNAYILVKQEDEKYIVYSYVKEDELSTEK